MEELKNCNLCKLASTRKNILIPCFTSAKGMIVSENPTSKEDKSGIYSDPSWKKVESALEYYGHRIDEFYVTSGIKCAPEVNRYPSQEEIKNCSKFFLKEISEIKPKAILFLGESIAKYYVHVDAYTYINRKFKTRLCDDVYVTYNPKSLRSGTQENDEFRGIFRQFIASCLS